MNRRTYLTAIATLFGGTLAGCADLDTDQTMTEDEAKDVFTHHDELNVDDISLVTQGERFVDEETGIAFYAFLPNSQHAGAGTTVTSEKLTDEQLENLD